MNVVTYLLNEQRIMSSFVLWAMITPLIDDWEDLGQLALAIVSIHIVVRHWEEIEELFGAVFVAPVIPKR